MKTLTKEKKIEFIRELVENEKITAYVIAKNTNITESGVQRLLNGSTKNPHINTVNGIYNYLMELYPAESEQPITGPEIEEINKSFTTHGADIKKNMGNLLETLVRKIIKDETAPEFQKINQNILSLFENQMALNRPDKKETTIKPLSANGGRE